MVNWINWAKVDPTEQDKLNKEQHESDHDGNLNKKSKENDNEFLKMDELQLIEELGMLAPAEQRIPYVRRNLLNKMNDADFFAFTRFTKDGVRRLAGLLAQCSWSHGHLAKILNFGLHDNVNT